jgi:hypothetical protein
MNTGMCTMVVQKIQYVKCCAATNGKLVFIAGKLREEGSSEYLNAGYLTFRNVQHDKHMLQCAKEGMNSSSCRRSRTIGGAGTPAEKGNFVRQKRWFSTTYAACIRSRANKLRRTHARKEMPRPRKVRAGAWAGSGTAACGRCGPDDQNV